MQIEHACLSGSSLESFQSNGVWGWGQVKAYMVSMCKVVHYVTGSWGWLSAVRWAGVFVWMATYIFSMSLPSCCKERQREEQRGGENRRERERERGVFKEHWTNLSRISTGRTEYIITTN